MEVNDFEISITPDDMVQQPVHLNNYKSAYLCKVYNLFF